MMTIRYFAVCLLILGMTTLLFAQESSEALTLDGCIRLAIQQNPLMLSSLQQYRASLARVHQAKAFPQPTLDYDSDLQPILFNFKESGESYLGISQTIEFPGKRSLRGKIASKESETILQDIDLLKLDIVFEVKQAFYGLLLAKEQFKYAEQNFQLSQDFFQKTQLKFSAGDVAKVEVMRASVEASKAANAVRTAENEVRLARAKLNFLLARKKYTVLEISGNLKSSPVALDLEELFRRAFTFRPELKRIKASRERESFQKKQGYMSYLPDLELGLSRHRMKDLESTWDVTLSLPIPLFFWQPRRGEIAEAEANLNALAKEEEHWHNAIILEVEEAYMIALTTQNQIKLFEDEIIRQAEEVYNMFLFSYQEGEIGGIELIDARRTMMESRKSYADALYNHDVALASLEKSIGQNYEGEQQ